MIERIEREQERSNRSFGYTSAMAGPRENTDDAILRSESYRMLSLASYG